MPKSKKIYTRAEINKILGDAKNHTLQANVKEDCILDGKPIIISDFDKLPPGSNSEIYRQVKENSWGESTIGKQDAPKTPKEAKKEFDKAIKSANKESAEIKEEVQAKIKSEKTWPRF